MTASEGASDARTTAAAAEASPTGDSAAAEPEVPSRTSARGKPGKSRRSRRREFYSIGEVCRTLGLKPHVLRYWETQFEGLSPAKNRAGNRVYRVEELELVALIQRLVHDEKYTIEGARQRLEEWEREGTRSQLSATALERSFLRMLRSELRTVLDLLDPASAR